MSNYEIYCGSHSLVSAVSLDSHGIASTRWGPE